MRIFATFIFSESCFVCFFVSIPPPPFQSRIILDEAHIIRNPSSKTHKACLELRSNLRWALTGTPCQNSSLDVFALLRFLQDQTIEWPSVKRTAKAIDGGKKEEQRQLQDKLRVVLLRRNKRSEINGKPIFEWPKVFITQNHLAFEDEERLLYNTVMTRYSDEFARLDALGELAEKRGVFFGLLYCWCIEKKKRRNQLRSLRLLFVFASFVCILCCLCLAVFGITRAKTASTF
jgi:SNF2 family DNA or RNA helicase